MSAPGAQARRALSVDLLKAVASQAIVLHHLAFYGPMADHAAVLAPALFDVLARDARIAVQVFLVVAGFLAAGRLAPVARLRPDVRLASALAARYLRLALPLAVAIALAVLASALARAWMDHPSVPAPPSWSQLLAHLLLVQDVLGIEALSAGVWYVAIDLQLYAALLLVLVLARGLARVLPGRVDEGRCAGVLVAAGVATSLLYANRQPALDVWAPYFFGAYGLGVLVAWYGRRRAPRWPLTMAALLVVVALLVEWRSRIALAGLVAAVLVMAPRDAAADRWAPGLGRVVHALGRTSYAVFLVHFPLCLVVNAAFERFVPHDPGWQALGVALAWLASLAGGFGFHRAVEVPLARPRGRPSPVADCGSAAPSAHAPISGDAASSRARPRACPRVP